MKKTLVFVAFSILSISLNASDGANIYKRCVGCHGANADQKYHPRASALINVTKEKRLKALESYKDGSGNRYGMGAVMKAQVKNLSLEDIKAVNEYIESLKK